MASFKDLLPVTQSLPIKLPNGELSGITFQVVSADSPQLEDVRNKHLQEEMGLDEPFTVLELQKRASERVAAVIVGWEGADEPYSPSAAFELMHKPEYRFIRDQVEGFSIKRTNFFPQSKTTA